MESFKQFVSLAFGPMDSKSGSAVIDALTIGAPSGLAALFGPGQWFPWLLAGAAIGVLGLMLVAGVRLQGSLTPLLAIRPHARWEQLHQTIFFAWGDKTTTIDAPAIFVGLRVSNVGLPQQAHAHVTYCDGTEAANWASPWQGSGKEYTRLSQGQSGQVLLFAIEDLEDGRWRVSPFDLGLTEDGGYALHTPFLHNKPFRFMVRVWGEGPGFWEIEAHAGIQEDGTPLLDMKEPVRGPKVRASASR